MTRSEPRAISFIWQARKRGIVGLIAFAMLLGVFSAFTVPFGNSANAAPEPGPIFFGCDAVATFDDGPGGWRSMSTRGLPAYPVYGDYGEVGWSATEGNPGGAAIATDRDGQWQEMWTPPLAANGFTTDYSFALGQELQFDYKNNTGIAYDVYVALQGADGRRYFYVFRPQIVNSLQWTRVIVPMDASRWVTQFRSSGPYGTPPSAADFASVLAGVDHFGFSIEGRSGADTTLFDNFGQTCDTDFGDAPASYGTAIGDDGASHGMPDFDAGNNTSPLMLGSSVDVEDVPAPSAGADGDDTTGADDEDGVEDPIVVTVGTQTTVRVVATNNTGSSATLAGWIDLNGNGTFDEAERVLATVPAGSGTVEYLLVFPASATTENTFARFRLFTGEVVSPLPTGTAIGGEVEDYPVTVVEPELRISKSSTMTADSRIGDTVTYTVTAENTGTGNYTESVPAVVLDDLAGVLDDAAYNDDVSAEASDGSDVPEPVFLEPSFLSWTGPLAVGESVTITYTVTLAGGGDRAVRNVAWQPSTPPPPGTPPLSVPRCDPATVEGADPVTGEVCGRTEGLLPVTALTLVKDVIGGSASAALWTLTASGPPAALPGPTGATGSPEATLVPVSPGEPYALSESGGPATYVQVGPWSCQDDTGAVVTVSASSEVEVGEGQQVTCTVTNDTAHITLLKNVADGPAAPADWNLTAAPDALAGLDPVTVPGASDDAGGNPGSTFEVRPGHPYTLTEVLADPGSPSTYRQVAMEIRNPDGSWSPVSSDQIVAPEAGEVAVYRFVNQMAPAIALPLTGGTGSDLYYLGGGILLLVALGLAAYSRVRRTRSDASRLSGSERSSTAHASQ